jgi:hypothetical protein
MQWYAGSPHDGYQMHAEGQTQKEGDEYPILQNYLFVLNLSQNMQLPMMFQKAISCSTNIRIPVFSVLS